ncbi:unnamed protein product [Clavelina lepadiformis]|uniref:NADH dehydrogenase [ubiquinone] 1 alpha subcomplex subunit 9, mitochondrial n=1 Tax=Clavelina lepadiformis TaxID=159417 RepID=A0ABP0FNH1_CLALP
MRALLKQRQFGLSKFSKRCTAQVVVAVSQRQERHLHESYIPKGHGGRSSFSGVVATVFGCTGFVGHVVVNHLAAMGSNVMLPFRGTGERGQRLKMMGDLGQCLLREGFSIKQEDDTIRDLIEHSNCVINLIGSRIPVNHYNMDEVNVEWPKRLAQLVAEKGDGTRFIHLTNLNCHQEEGRNVSNILQQNYEAERAICEIYPASTIVRSANMHGFNDHYTHFFVDPRFSRFSYVGAYPVLYDGGHSTVVQPVSVSDAAEGIARVTRHPDAMGHTFEFVGPDRFTLHDMCEYIFSAAREECHPYNTIGPLDRSKAKWHQQIFHKFLEIYFRRLFKPTPFLPRFLDLLLRDNWVNFDYYKQLHLTDRTTGAPGLHELGVEPMVFEDKAFEYFASLHEDFVGRSGEEIPKTGPEMKEPVHGVPRLTT